MTKTIDYTKMKFAQPFIKPFVHRDGTPDISDRIIRHYIVAKRIPNTKTMEYGYLFKRKDGAICVYEPCGDSLESYSLGVGNMTSDDKIEKVFTEAHAVQAWGGYEGVIVVSANLSEREEHDEEDNEYYTYDITTVLYEHHNLATRDGGRAIMVPKKHAKKQVRELLAHMKKTRFDWRDE